MTSDEKALRILTLAERGARAELALIRAERRRLEQAIAAKQPLSTKAA